jgi:two-component system phosphate regulon sensor histidine kinase PhoR
MQFSIRSSMVRFGIFASALIIAIIVIFQLIWLKKVYQFEQKEFDISVLKAIRGLYEDLNLYNTSNLDELVERPDRHLYLARINLPVNYDSLKSNLRFELEDFDIYTNCTVGIYEASSRTYKYSTILLSAGTQEKSNPALPELKRTYDYIALYFPNRQKYILYEMNFWVVGTIILLIVLLVSAGSLYFLYRQKFFNELQKDFIQDFTHEFKTPVATLALAAETLENKNIIEKPEKLATYTAIVKYQADYLNKQIERLLKFAHSESTHLHPEKKTINIHDLITESIANISPLVEEKNANLVLKLNAQEPNVFADKDYMIIMITNLIENAIKYSRHPLISVTTANENRHFVISVKDNGIGIGKNQMKKLFMKFYRIRNNEEYVAKGFGIGLTIVKKIVTAHKGKIHVESAPGKGSTFTIEMPQA